MKIVLMKTLGIEYEEEAFRLKCYKYNALQGSNHSIYIVSLIKYEFQGVGVELEETVNSLQCLSTIELVLMPMNCICHLVMAANRS